MHARDLVEVAVIVVTRAERFFEGVVMDQADGRRWKDYWTISRCRLDRWRTALTPVGKDAGGASARAVAEEILASEILTRVWTAMISIAPESVRFDQEPIARNVFLAHQEARNQVLQMLNHPELLSSADAIALNRLRRRCERWTDLLLAYLSQHGGIDEFAFDTERVHDFADDLLEDGVFEGRNESWLMLLASLRNAFQQGFGNGHTNADLNKELAATVLGSMPAADMSDLELPGAMWQVRLETLTSEAEVLVKELFALDDLAVTSTQPANLRFDGRHKAK